MAISIAWLLDKLGNKQYAWSQTKAVMDFDRGGSSGQTLGKTLNDGLIQEYTCVTQGITHALTGTGNNIKFVADAPFNEGDTITVNGSLVSAYTQDGGALAGGAWNTSMTVVCYLDGSALTVSGGGNAYTPPAYSTSEWVPTGETWIDGKPIYQKVLNAGYSNNETITELSNADNIVQCGGYFQYSDAPYVSIFPSAGSNPSRCCTFKRQGAGQFKYEIAWNTNPSSIKNVNIVVRATLT